MNDPTAIDIIRLFIPPIGLILLVWGIKRWIQGILRRRNLDYNKLTQEMIENAHARYYYDEDMRLAYMNGAADFFHLVEKYK